MVLLLFRQPANVPVHVFRYHVMSHSEANRFQEVLRPAENVAGEQACHTLLILWVPYIVYFLLRITYHKDYRWHNWFILAALIGSTGNLTILLEYGYFVCSFS